MNMTLNALNTPLLVGFTPAWITINLKVFLSFYEFWYFIWDIFLLSDLDLLIHSKTPVRLLLKF